MMPLRGKRILYGITGSIAAVKAPIVARELMRAGAEVVPVLTDGATRFTTALALSALTKQSAVSSIFPSDKSSSSDAGTWHIHLARSADAMVIAPCSATTLGKLRAGVYDNAVTLLASSLPPGTPLILAPAMDEEMWLQAAVQENLEWMRQHGATIIDPVSGPLASGHTGMGRMKEPSEVVAEVGELIGIHRGPLSGKKVLITGGPTYEPIDPVRFIGNRSSGKMAAALAEAATRAGARVTLIMGPSVVVTDRDIHRVDVETAQQMLEAVRAEASGADIFIMNAAVSDFTPASVSDAKLKKHEIENAAGGWALELTKTTDILKELGQTRAGHQYLVGFALEKGDVAEDYAKSKLQQKGLDMIVLNKVDDAGAGFAHDTNRVTIFTSNGTRRELELMSKTECARAIVSEIAEQIASAV